LRLLGSAIAAVPVLLICATIASAQRADVYFAMGTARDDAIEDWIDSVPGLAPGAIDGLFGTIGGGYMFNDTLGLGGEASFRFAQGDYAGYGYRPVFYDFNGILTPTLGSDRVMAEFQGGIGGLSLRVYGGEEYCDYYTGQCTNYLGSVNHFQVHASAGLRIYVTDSVFIRPQFDYRYVPNLNEEFKSNSVFQYTVAIGFSSFR